MAQTAADPRIAVRQEVERLASGGQVDPGEVFRLGGAALQLRMPREADAMFAMAVRILHHYIERRDAPRALSVEGAIYNTFVKAVEDEDHCEKQRS